MWYAIYRVKGISTHTLTWSVTLHAITSLSKNIYFNSHAHVERDENSNVNPDMTIISTHTLTWSVTSSFVKGVFHVLKFQLTRSRGA